MRNLILLTVCLGGLAGCSHPLDAPLSSRFGEAFASMDSQIIPATVSDLPPETSGAVAAAATARYHKGEVKALETQYTSAIGSGGGK